MGLRFRRSVRLFPGVRLNFSGSGISASVGGRGATVNVGKRGVRSTVGIPGSGLSYTTNHMRLSSGGGQSMGTPTSNGCGWIAAAAMGLIAVATCSMKTPLSQNSADAAATNTEAPAIPSAPLANVSAKIASCRANPSPKAARLSRFRRGAEVKVLEEKAGWSRVDSAGQECWIASSSLATPTDELADQPASAAMSQPLVSSYGNTSASSSSRSSRAGAASRSRRYGSPRGFYGGACPCSGSNVCIGPRGGRYCITSGGNKRYGV